MEIILIDSYLPFKSKCGEARPSKVDPTVFPMKQKRCFRKNVQSTIAGQTIFVLQSPYQSNVLSPFR